MTLEQALEEYGEVVVVKGNANDLEQVGYCYPLTATTMAFEERKREWNKKNNITKSLTCFV